MTRTVPPFRGDQVGSLLRPPELKRARADRAEGKISADDLRAVEDRLIRQAIARQEAIGLQGVTDGEYRRAWWHLDFIEALGGMEPYTADHGIQFQGGVTPPRAVRTKGKVHFAGHPFLDHFKFVHANTTKTAKFTIPSPSVLYHRGGRKAVPESVYPKIEDFFHDMGEAYRQAVAAFGAAGCEYLQLDEVNFTYLCDPAQRQLLKERGDDPDHLLHAYAGMINQAISGRTPGMRMTMHLCRGNFKSMWIAQGGYEPVADVLFNKIGIDAYFMEWDTERAGGFEPLRLVPKNKQVVLGIVTSKVGALETKDSLKRRLEEASKFIDLEQLCLSPQCGFASTEEGNLLTEEEQWAKLGLVVEVAKEVWG